MYPSRMLQHLLTNELGISFNETMYFCVDCQMFTCTDCHDCHDREHIRKMLRFDVLQWMPKLPGIKSTSSCRYCVKETKTRWECYSCGWTLCRSCAAYFSRRQEFFAEHRESDPNGRHFFSTYPPYWNMLSQWVTDPCPCLEPEPVAITHCERCHKSGL
jgi:hypothetical protein